MARLNVSQVQLNCVVEGCRDNPALLERHHLGSQKLFVWHFRRRRSRRYRAFCARYHRFNQKDCVRICRNHHERVHDFYRPIIAKHCWKLKLPLRSFSWKQAEILMEDLEKHFYIWKQQEESRLARSS